MQKVDLHNNIKGTVRMSFLLPLLFGHAYGDSVLCTCLEHSLFQMHLTQLSILPTFLFREVS